MAENKEINFFASGARFPNTRAPHRSCTLPVARCARQKPRVNPDGFLNLVQKILECALTLFRFTDANLAFDSLFSSSHNFATPSRAPAVTPRAAQFEMSSYSPAPSSASSDSGSNYSNTASSTATSVSSRGSITSEVLRQPQLAKSTKLEKHSTALPLALRGRRILNCDNCRVRKSRVSRSAWSGADRR